MRKRNETQQNTIKIIVITIEPLLKDIVSDGHAMACTGCSGQLKMVWKKITNSYVIRSLFLIFSVSQNSVVFFHSILFFYF